MNEQLLLCFYSCGFYLKEPIHACNMLHAFMYQACCMHALHMLHACIKPVMLSCHQFLRSCASRSVET